MQTEDTHLSLGEGKIFWRSESSVKRLAYIQKRSVALLLSEQLCEIQDKNALFLTGEDIWKREVPIL